MKTKIFLSTLLTLAISAVFLFASCGKSDEKTQDVKKDEKEVNGKKESSEVKANEEHAIIKLPSIQCSMCKKTITKALKKIDGVTTIEVDVDGKTAHIHYLKEKTNITKIENVITSAGYDANDKKANPKAYENLDDCCKLPKDRKEKTNEH